MKSLQKNLEKKIRTQLPECAQFTDVKSIKAFNVTFYNNRRSAIARNLEPAQLN